MRIPVEMHAEIERMYTDDLLSCGAIAERVGCTRPRIHQILKARGVDTRKRMQVAKCVVCGAETQRTRPQVRKTRRCYCSQACYMKAISNSGYKESRQGTRVARGIIAGTLSLLPGMVVHHMDGDQFNNDPTNLYVFESSSEHMRYHRSSSPVRAFSMRSFGWVTLENQKFAQKQR